MKFIMILISISFFSSFVGAEDFKKAEPWEFISEEDGLKLYIRSRAGSQIKEVKANVVYQGTVQEALDIMFDRLSHPQVFKYIKFSDVLKKNETCDWSYNIIDAPMASDRDYLVKSCMVKNKDGSVSVIWTPFEDDRYPIGDERVRVLINQGYWRFTQVEPDKIRVDYYIYTDPAGDLPLWVKNIANKKAVPNSMRELHKEIMKRREAKTKKSS